MVTVTLWTSEELNVRRTACRSEATAQVLRLPSVNELVSVLIPVPSKRYPAFTSIAKMESNKVLSLHEVTFIHKFNTLSKETNNQKGFKEKNTVAYSNVELKNSILGKLKPH